jgi:hypothetical protein
MNLLEQDLLVFSGFNKVVFDVFTYGDELETLYCDIDYVETSFTKEGNKFNIYNGLLSFACPMGKTGWDILAEKYELCDKSKLFGILTLNKVTQTLRYTRSGSNYNNGKYDRNFLRVSNGFSYIIDSQFNKKRSKITNLSINIKEKP